MSKSSPAARSKARRFALQGLYQMKMSECSAIDVEEQYTQDHDMKRVDTDYLHELLSGIVKHQEQIDGLIASKIDRRFDELDPIETAILRIGTFEMVHRVDVPWRVVINESVELAHSFGAAESHRYVNSILDSIARDHRAVEINKKRWSG
ncbi:MAG: transcription antitermination factor NusB [Pseudomonadales bacterium]